MSRTGPPAIRVRRGIVLAVSLVVPVALVVWGGHPGIHMARNLLIPGAGVIDHAPWLAALFVVLAIASTVLWLQWGAGWTVGLVVLVSTVVSGLLARAHPTAPRAVADWVPVRSAHEFPLVILVVAAIAWVRSVLGRLPGIRSLVVRRNSERRGSTDLGSLRPADRCRAASVILLTRDSDPIALESAWADDVRRRARRINVVARGRFASDPFLRDHAEARTAECLAGRLSSDGLARLASDARRTSVGVPCSEPSWVRPLDATLAALALERVGVLEPAIGWSAALHAGFGLRRGHRAAWWWTPLDLCAGSAPSWEHAAFSGLARAAGWIGDDDWAALRKRALGAAARGTEHPEDERLVAAARVWLAFVDDPEARRIIMRPGVRRDPLACALDRLAAQLCDNPGMLRSAAATAPPGGDQK